MIELWRDDDPHGRVQCQTRSRRGGQCLRYQDHGGEHVYGPRRNEDAAEVALHRATDEGLILAFAELTHRLHVADRQKGPDAAILALDLRSQRNRVQEEILRRMKG